MTAPVPEPPVVLKVEVPPGLTVVGEATAVMVCAANTVTVTVELAAE